MNTAFTREYWLLRTSVIVRKVRQTWILSFAHFASAKRVRVVAARPWNIAVPCIRSGGGKFFLLHWTGFCVAPIESCSTKRAFARANGRPDELLTYKYGYSRSDRYQLPVVSLHSQHTTKPTNANEMAAKVNIVESVHDIRYWIEIN